MEATSNCPTASSATTLPSRNTTRSSLFVVGPLIPVHLARRSNDNLTIRQYETTGDIVIRLYQTDIITYINDGDGYNNPIELNPYPSSTYQPSYVQHPRPLCIHPLVRPTLHCPRLHHWGEWAVLQTPRYMPSSSLKNRAGHWSVVRSPSKYHGSNRKEAKQALRDANFYTFQTWIETLIRLNNDPRSETSYRTRPFDWSPHEAMKYLTAGEDGWREIAGRMSRRVDIKREYEMLRTAVYKSELCYDIETIPYFTSYRELQNALNRLRRAD